MQVEKLFLITSIKKKKKNYKILPSGKETLGFKDYTYEWHFELKI